MNSKRYVLVAGGSGGIGAAVCRQAAHAGLVPIVGYHRQPDAAALIAQECGGEAVQLDMHSESSIVQAVEALAQFIGTQGVLAAAVLAASPPPDLLPFTQLTSDQFLNQFQVNVVGPHLLLSGLIKKFFRKTKSGVVVGILSQGIGGATQAPASGMGAYVTAKGALRMMLEVCQVEYPWLQVRTVSPGFTRTKMLDVFDERYLELAAAQQAFSTPEEVAQLIVKALCHE